LNVPNSAEEIVAYLRSNGPSVASEVADHIVQISGCTKETARKRIERSKPIVSRLNKIKFPTRTQFLYMEDQYGKERFWKRLLLTFKTTGSIYGQVVNALSAKGGVVPTRLFGIISGSPKRLKKHVSSDSVLSNLIDIGLLKEVEYPGVGDCVQFYETVPLGVINHKQFRARHIAENILINGLGMWLRKSGLVAFQQLQTRNKSSIPDVAQFEWDISAPSYALPFVSKGGGNRKNPGFVVLDATLSEQATEEQIQYFITKSKIIHNQRSTRPILPIFVAQGFTRGALHLGQSSGVVVTTLSNLLGSEIAVALKSLLQTLEHAAEAAAENPQILTDLFDKLSAIEGAAGNLRGVFFEMIVGHCVQQKEAGYIDIGLTDHDPNSGEQFEIDVLRYQQHQEICIYECKGYQPTNEISEEEIKKWLSKLPKIRNWILANSVWNKCSKIKFEFWTTGKFSQDAKALLDKQKKSTKKYCIDWKDGDQVYTYASSINSPHIKKALNEHYRKHPITKNLS